MCGIVYVKRADGKPAHKQVLKRYRKQKNRGEDGFGYVALDGAGKIAKFSRYQFEHEVKESLEKTKHDHVLFHHRYPTSTINVPESAHPIYVNHQELKHDYYVVHNGVITNDDTLKEAHDKLGYSYTTELVTKYQTAKGKMFYGASAYNDSEALAIELARTIEGLQPYVNATGAIAYIVLQVNKANDRAIALYFGTNGGNPLTITQGPTGLVIASEGGRKITDNVCYRLNLKTNETTTASHVCMASYSTYKAPSTGFGAYDSANSYFHSDSYITDAEYSSMVEEELQEELESADRAIADIDADIAIAKQVGEEDEIQDLEIEKITLLEQRARIMRVYDKKTHIPF